MLLYVAYARGGLDRFRQASVADYLRELEELRAAGVRVGVAPHSVRACPRDWLEELGRYAAAEELPLHVHADEQPREIEECLAEHGVRPIELLAETGCLTPRTTVVHATHADGRELDLLAEAGARVCACPTTEANLGDGFLPVERLLHRGIRLCIGSDSNVRIDPLEELRELDGIARRQSGRRDVFAVDTLLGDRRRRGRRLARARRSGRRSRSTRRIRSCAASRIRGSHSSPAARPTSSSGALVRTARASSRAAAHLVRRERARLVAVHLDEPPDLVLDHERQHQERAVAERPQENLLPPSRRRGRPPSACAAPATRAPGRSPGSRRRDSPVRAGASCRPRVLRDEDQHVADHAGDAARVRVEGLDELAGGRGEDVDESDVHRSGHSSTIGRRTR